MIFFITKLFWFIYERIYREFVHVFWIDRRFEKEVYERGAAYVDKLIQSMSGYLRTEIDPFVLKDEFIGFEASLASIKINGDMKFFNGSILGLNSLTQTDSCSLTAKDNLLHVNADLMAGPLSFYSWVTIRFLGFEEQFYMKGKLSLVEFICKFTITPEKDKNGLFEGLFIRQLKGMEFWIQEGPWLLKWLANISIASIICFLKPFVRNIIEYILECRFKSAFFKYELPTEEYTEILSTSKSSEYGSAGTNETSDTSDYLPTCDSDSTHSDSGTSESAENESNAENESDMTKIKSKPIFRPISQESVSHENFITAKDIADLRKSFSLELKTDNDLVTMGNQLKNNNKCPPITNGLLHKNSPSCDKDKKHYETAITGFNERDDEIRKLFAEVGNLLNNTNSPSIPNGSSITAGNLHKIVPSGMNKKPLEAARTQFIERHDETRKLWAEVQNQLKYENNHSSITNGNLLNVSDSDMNKKNLENTIEFMKRHDEVNKLWKEVKLASQGMKLDNGEIDQNEKENFNSTESLKFVPKGDEVNGCPYETVCPYKNATKSKRFLDSISIAFEGRKCMTDLEMVEKDKRDYQTTSIDEIPVIDNLNAKNTRAPFQNEFEGPDTLKNFFNNSLTVANESAIYNNIITPDNANGVLRKLENNEKSLEVETDTTKSSLKRFSETPFLERSPKSRRCSPGSPPIEIGKENILEMVRQSSKLSNLEVIHKDTKDLWSPKRVEESHRISNSESSTFIDLLSYSAMMPKYRSSNFIAAENDLKADKGKNNEIGLRNDKDGCVENHQLDSCDDQFVDMLLYSAMMPKSIGLTDVDGEKNLSLHRWENKENLFFSNDEDGCEVSQQSSCDDQFDIVQYSAMIPKSVHPVEVLEISINEPDESGNESDTCESTEDVALESATFQSPSEDTLRSVNVEDPNTKETVPVMQTENESKTIEYIYDVIMGDAGNGVSNAMDILATASDIEVLSKENNTKENHSNSEETDTTCVTTSIKAVFNENLCEAKPEHITVSPKQFATFEEIRSQVKFSSVENKAATLTEVLSSENLEHQPNKKTDTIFDTVSRMNIRGLFDHGVAATVEQSELSKKEAVEPDSITRVEDIADDSKQTSSGVAIGYEVYNRSDHSHEDPIKKEKTDLTYDTASGVDILDVDVQEYVAICKQSVETLMQSETPKNEAVEHGVVARVDDSDNCFSKKTGNEVATGADKASNIKDPSQENPLTIETTFEKD